MDGISLIFYAVVCGVLSLLAPLMRSMVARLAFGAGVGVVAAAVLPLVRALMAG